MKTVNEEDFWFVMAKIRDLRAWAVQTGTDPWAVRQGLLFAIAIDTDAALERGISPDELTAFDTLAMQYTQEFVQEMRRVSRRRSE